MVNEFAAFVPEPTPEESERIKKTIYLKNLYNQLIYPAFKNSGISKIPAEIFSRNFKI